MNDRLFPAIVFFRVQKGGAADYQRRMRRYDQGFHGKSKHHPDNFVTSNKIRLLPDECFTPRRDKSVKGSPSLTVGCRSRMLLT